MTLEPPWSLSRITRQGKRACTYTVKVCDVRGIGKERVSKQNNAQKTGMAGKIEGFVHFSLSEPQQVRD
jgi:hypothetical protein